MFIEAMLCGRPGNSGGEFGFPPGLRKNQKSEGGWKGRGGDCEGAKEKEVALVTPRNWPCVHHLARPTRQDRGLGQAGGEWWWVPPGAPILGPLGAHFTPQAPF